MVDLATNLGQKRASNQPKATDSTLRDLASLTSIETLELGNNRDVTDAGLVHLEPLKSLTTVYLYKTGIRGPGLVHLADLPNLESISLSYTPLEDSGAVQLGKMSRLTWASLDNTKLTDAGMPELVKASSLKTLTLNNTSITDNGLMYLTRLTHLEQLGLRGTGVTSNGVARLEKALPKCQIIVTFGLGETPRDELLFPDGYEPTPAEINDKLKVLGIDGEVETDATRPGHPIVSFRLFRSRLSNRVVLDLIKHMPELETLNLRYGLVGGDFVKDLEGLPIRYFSLQGTRITDEGLQYLALLPDLKELILSETDVSDAGVLHLECLKYVDSIMLDQSRISFEGIHRLKKSLPKNRLSW